jgi:hypothetical protein
MWGILNRPLLAKKKREKWGTRPSGQTEVPFGRSMGSAQGVSLKKLIHIGAVLLLSNTYFAAQAAPLDVSGYSSPSDDTISFPKGSPVLPEIGIYHVGGAVSAPRRIGACCPGFTVPQSPLGNSETVPIPAIITEDGGVRVLQTAEGPTLLTDVEWHEALSQAVEVASKSNFYPARRNGKPVPVGATLHVRLGMWSRQVEY